MEHATGSRESVSPAGAEGHYGVGVDVGRGDATASRCFQKHNLQGSTVPGVRQEHTKR